MSTDYGKAVEIDKDTPLNIEMLKFVHIPKSAGTSVEVSGAQNAIKWGERDAGRFARYRPTCGPNVSIRHIPLDCFELGNPYKDFHVFAVVRNPIERIISAYNFLHRGPGKKEHRNAEHLNHWIKTQIEAAKESPYIHTNMLLPQHKFIIYEREDCKVHYILRFERINEEFEELTARYGKPLKLHHHCFKSNSGLMRNDLTPESMTTIKDFYRKDFELWYPNELHE